MLQIVTNFCHVVISILRTVERPICLEIKIIYRKSQVQDQTCKKHSETFQFITKLINNYYKLYIVSWSHDAYSTHYRLTILNY